ncbi:precorrin-2 C20-methyltransferase / precorrin-3B C17-methyltransferase [Pseudonocardia thermophila]|uniref:Precorrin-2 C20-methyltransferase / precorrin-3B C17-methyltransferase n=1 Tax=Pseudonocardia thermophila TaxID=1848 RepID=A0A1M6YHL1_PSETH|nr:precorrin-2 C(20)-methyltransferase [Pseudonocardia thermophila]SHL17698.1 precorrin-2 C20-methyltransferase / precorrin-3B C17-methyltransferase [Pseudonocardia thermophila]
MTVQQGTLYGVGVGPGDPELVTVKAARLITAAPVIAYHAARHGRSHARRIAEPYLRPGQIEEPLIYPVTTETTDHPGGYQGAIDEFYTHAATRLAAHLDAGRDVVLLAEGDPLFYSSYMHLHKRLAHRYRTHIVPGVTSLAGATAALAQPLVERDEVLTVLPGTLPRDELARRLADTDAAAILKLGRTFPTVAAAITDSGRDALYVAHATTPHQHTAHVNDVDPASVPYFAIAIVPGTTAATQPHSTNTTTRENAGEIGGESVGEVVVVGTGPAGRDWLTPQAAAALADVDDLIGYGPYLDRVPPNPRQTRHPSDNRVEADRAAHALDLAATGRRVAVVSGGDPGIFAMAAAVHEVAAQDKYRHIPIRVLPGVTAASAVAAAAGAPLGHDHAVISLSDRLKPWPVITNRLIAAAAADLAIAIYNPRSTARPWQLGAARDLLLQHRAPDTPVVLGRDVGGPGERITITTLAELDPEQVDMRTLVIIGSSRTRVVQRADGPAVYTPRWVPVENEPVVINRPN